MEETEDKTEGRNNEHPVFEKVTIEMNDGSLILSESVETRARDNDLTGFHGI